MQQNTYLSITPHHTTTASDVATYVYANGLSDLMFLIKSLELPTASFNNIQYISFISTNTIDWETIVATTNIIKQRI